MQDTFGIRLIEKSPTGIALTEMGAAFQRDVDMILGLLGGLKIKYKAPSLSHSEESIVLGASYGISTSLMPSLMTEFKKTHPHAKLSLYTNDSAEIVKLVLESKLDIGIASSPKKSAALNIEPFLSSELCAFVAAKHPLAKRRTITLKELARIRLVARVERGSFSRTELLLKQLRRFCPKPDLAFRCGSPEAVKTAVRQGTGVGILVDSAVMDESSRKEFKTLKIVGVDLKAKSWILYPKRKSLSKTAEAFLALLRASRVPHRNA